MASTGTTFPAIPDSGGGLTNIAAPTQIAPECLKLPSDRGVKLRVSIAIDPATTGGGLASFEDNAVQSPLLRAFAPLHRSALGVACGVVLGGLISAATLVLVLQRGYPPLKLYLLAQFFWGYSVSWQGVFIGFLWGCSLGFVIGYGFAIVRNATVWLWLTVIRSRAEMDQYSDFLDHL